ncbi:MAG TPA: tetratricopeptide repeat protein [Polyangiaceae bacterium]
MTDLTPDDEALLQRARDADAPTADDHARVKRKLALQLGVAIGVSTTAGSATGAGVGTGVAAGTTAVVGSGLVVKVVAAVAVVAALGGGAAGVKHWRNAPKAVPTTTVPAVMALAPTATPTATPTTTPTTTTTTTTTATATAILAPVNPPAPVTARARDVAPSPIVHEWTDVPASPATAASPPPAPVVTADVPAPTTALPAGPTTLDAEADLLRRADVARKGGDAAGALALLEQHRARYPNGILVEEREAERIVVLCALGRTDEARAAAGRFLRDHPRSPQAARVRASCGGG